jgi:hypothetical protein
LPDVVCLFAFSRQFIFIYFYSIRKEEGRRWWVLEGRKKEGKKEGEKERRREKKEGGRWREREEDDGDWTWPPRGDQSPLVQH